MISERELKTGREQERERERITTPKTLFSQFLSLCFCRFVLLPRPYAIIAVIKFLFAEIK